MTHAEGRAKSLMTTVTDAKSDAAAVTEISPPPSSQRSTGKSSSNRSNRKVEQMLQKLEEQKQLEQKYLDEKYRILNEEDGDETILSDDGMGSEEASKVRRYLEKGYVRKLTELELKTSTSKEWYLSVFPVVNPNKPGKARLVWDAVAPAYGVSLNSLLLKGPVLLTSLLVVPIKFREFQIAICGDIREMYLQILLKQDVQLCFFWNDEQKNANPGVFCMLGLQFGVSCAPSIAQYVKIANARQFEKDYPAAVRAIVDQHYVDDMLVSVESAQEAVKIAQDVKKIHARTGFEMRHWISNCPAVLEVLHERTTEEKDLNMTEGLSTKKVLGMWWNTTTDCFTFKVSPRYDPELMSGQRKPTKREVLRTLMMIFDPLGLIGHFLMFLKVVLQEIWRSSVGWDEPIEEQQFKMWMQWLKVLPEAAQVEIPRGYRTATSVGGLNEVQMHIFVDASEKGFAAVAYLRFEEGSIIETALVGSKTRVAPIKFLSIPSLELQACVIGVRLASTIMQSLAIIVNRRFFWTDSSDVISWLKSDHRRYSPFVAVHSPVLTPNHFLLGSSNGIRPWVPFGVSSEVLKNRWKLSQILANRFWKLWLRDYLPSITRRTKWFKETKPISINDIVIIVDPNFPRNTWPKGRVIRIKKGSDGQVRSATVQTSSGFYEQPTVKLAVLDVGVGSNAPQEDPKPITGGSVDCATVRARSTSHAT
ncbi:uncharacterized protein LOC128745743 [Sabethes cyaneus]|uniref:uncharacterized protein LOC128745743 n=1 Tax=Sabethes cyaneus TaxID=53552 RepID=UPI00237EBFC3|nr:uncharacterized protein LOC128745743 [Sabethes cyaneus]